MTLSVKLYSRWRLGSPEDAYLFPIAVWLSLPLWRRNAQRPTTAEFTVQSLAERATAEVLGEGRRFTVRSGLVQALRSASVSNPVKKQAICTIHLLTNRAEQVIMEMH